METGVSFPGPSSSSPPQDSDLHHPDFSPVGSPNTNFYPPSDYHQHPHPHHHQHHHHHHPPPPLSDDLRAKIIKQVEYYFSDENLSTDKFLMKHITKDEEGFVPIVLIASFKKMKKLTRDVSSIVAALRESSLLVVSPNGRKVKRPQPLPFTEARDPQLCTILVENLPEDHSLVNLRRIFGEAGNVKHISIRDPHSVKDPKKCTVAEKLLSGKLHALVEYDNVEAAEKAVDLLNNEQDWRFGLRVKLLKKMNKPGQRKKVWRELDPEKNSSVQASDAAPHTENHHLSDHQDDSHDEEDGEQLPKEKNGDQLLKEKNGDQLPEKNGENPPKENNGNRARNRGRGRRQKNRGTNGHGHGTHSFSYHFEPSKPPPGPRMPDGTKGFTMGRGRPLVVNQN